MSLRWFLALCACVAAGIGTVALRAQVTSKLGMGNVTISSAAGEPAIRIVCQPDQPIALAVELNGKVIHSIGCTK